MKTTNRSHSSLGAEALLLLTAAIWGFAFVAQRVGMASIGPFAFNALRFALGALSLLPLYLVTRRPKGRREAAGLGMPTSQGEPRPTLQTGLLGGVLAGSVLFMGASLQQAGLVTTTAGNAGFITSLYVVLVPLLGLFAGRRVGLRVWLGALLALAGLYLISIGSGFTMAPGDLLELAGAFFWAFHILVIGRLAGKIDALLLAILQFATASGLSALATLAFESPSLAGVRTALVPLLYGGLLSTGVAFTLQIVAQRRAHPAVASIILSMESLFAGLGGIILLGEPFSLRFGLGAALMLAGLVVSQLPAQPQAPLSTGLSDEGHA